MVGEPQQLPLAFEIGAPAAFVAEGFNNVTQGDGIVFGNDRTLKSMEAWLAAAIKITNVAKSPRLFAPGLIRMARAFGQKAGCAGSQPIMFAVAPQNGLPAETREKMGVRAFHSRDAILCVGADDAHVKDLVLIQQRAERVTFDPRRGSVERCAHALMA